MTMSNKWFWLIIGAAVVGACIVGVLVGQEGRKYPFVGQQALKYPYLSAEYSKPYIPTQAEWGALRLMARFNGVQGLSNEILSNFVMVEALPDHLSLRVDTQPQPGSEDIFTGPGRFSCSDREVRVIYQRAAARIMKNVRDDFFPSIDDEDVKIEFSAKGFIVGTWTGGKMTLAGEE